MVVNDLPFGEEKFSDSGLLYSLGNGAFDTLNISSLTVYPLEIPLPINMAPHSFR